MTSYTTQPRWDLHAGLLRQEYIHTLIMFNSYCFSMTAVVTRTRFSVTLHYIAYLAYCYFCQVLFVYFGPVWAETRTQSGDWYGSGTLHPGQVLRGSLPLLSPLFRCSHFSPRGASTSATTWEIPAAEVGTVGENVLSGNFAEMMTSTPFGDLLHAVNVRHGTDGFTYAPKGGVLRIFSPLKIRRLWSGLNPRI